MFNPRALFCTVLICGLLAGCGLHAKTSAEVSVTVDGVHHACIVALSKEAQGSSIACADIVAFIKDELRVPSGAVCEVLTIPTVSDTELAAVSARLKNAGYRLVGER